MSTRYLELKTPIDPIDHRSIKVHLQRAKHEEVFREELIPGKDWEYLKEPSSYISMKDNVQG